VSNTLTLHRAAAGHVNRLYSFDPASNTWAELTASVGGARPYGRKDSAAAVLGGRIWLFGGWTDDPAVGPYGGVLNDVHVYDPAAGGGADGAWFGPLQAASPPQARAGHYMTAVAGRMYSFGGYTDWPGPHAPRSLLCRCVRSS
jgi:N-acetylneuraminic acid mutarotase